jgi:hypothetical protein
MIQVFLKEHLIEDPDSRVSVADLFSEWRRWAKNKGVDIKEVGDENSFRSLVVSNGYREIKNTTIKNKKAKYAIKGLAIPGM